MPSKSSLNLPFPVFMMNYSSNWTVLKLFQLFQK
jgi:hypothetical protein